MYESDREENRLLDVSYKSYKGDKSDDSSDNSS